MVRVLIDIALIGIVAFCAWRGFRNGLIRGVFGVASLILALFVANIAAQAFHNEAKGLLAPLASGVIESTIAELQNQGIEYQEPAVDHEVAGEAFGVAYTALREIGLPEPAAEHIAVESVIPAPDDTTRSFPDIIADRLTGTLSYIAVFGIAFLIISIVFAVIGNLIGFVFALPGLRLVDSIVGVVFGVFRGLIIVYTLALLLRYFGILMPSLIEETVVLRFLITNNPIANIFGV